MATEPSLLAAARQDAFFAELERWEHDQVINTLRSVMPQHLARGFPGSSNRRAMDRGVDGLGCSMHCELDAQIAQGEASMVRACRPLSR